MPNLLVEIGCEELPAAACREAEAQLPALVRRHMGEEGLLRVLVGPRRLAVLVEGLPEREPDRVERRRGPSEAVAFDAAGAPTRAAAGFARANGLAAEELERADGFVWATTRSEGRELASLLPEAIAALVRELAFGKSMRWRADGLRFSRPVRWICAKLDAADVSVALADIPSGGVSYGHRFTEGRVRVPDADAYLETLRAVRVEPDHQARRAAIVRGLDALGDWHDPRGVLEEVIHLAEWPIVLAGAYDERFLELPLAVVETTMQSHQRYFPLGAGRFAFVANGGDPAVVVAGNERVLEGRLDDALFSYERDAQLGIEAMAASLGRITFHARAGSYADKTARLVALCEALGGGEAALEAARLAKADQASAMVKEFAELEGRMGAVYARLAGVPDGVAEAIAEQYLPDASGGDLPRTAAGRVLAAAEKLDNLTVAFAVGERPTGSRDPYGLRRAAIGLCRLALESEFALELRMLVGRDYDLLAEQSADLRDARGETVEAVWDYVLRRLEELLDVPVEFVRAARAATVGELGAVAHLARTLARAAGTDAFERAFTAYDRSGRLAARANGAADALDPALLEEPAERALVDALAAAGGRIADAVGSHDFDLALASAAELGPAVDRFFDEVLVMAEDEAVRANRLRLLLDVRDAVGAIGDLSQVPR